MRAKWMLIESGLVAIGPFDSYEEAHKFHQNQNFMEKRYSIIPHYLPSHYEAPSPETVTVTGRLGGNWKFGKDAPRPFILFWPEGL